MSGQKRTVARRRAAARRRRRRTLIGIGVAVAALAIALAILLLRPSPDGASVPSPIPPQADGSPAEVAPVARASEDASSEAAASEAVEADAASEAIESETNASEAAEAGTASEAIESKTPAQAAEPSPVPEPTATVVPGSRPDVVSFYTPQGKNYSPRVRMGDTYTAPWKKGEDIGSFEVIASDEAFLDGSFFGDIFGAAWTAFPDANSCKIGYTLRYTLDNGSEIKYSMLSPSHIEHTEYIECWLYDDYHREPHKFYSHLKPSRMKPDTLITSIKLTAGRQISHVTDIWLTAYICASLDDFDAERNYIGDTSCTIHILKQ